MTPRGRLPFGFATGFLYAGPSGTRWLVTNWHVVTGRRPDDPAMLIGTKPNSPSWLRFRIEDPFGSGSQEMEVDLYDGNGPTWIEHDREAGVDLALIRLKDKPLFPLPFSQTFAPNSLRTLEPGLDVVLVGHPFELGTHAASAIWKGAMVASDRDEPGTGRPWILVDAPGVPGMSGSPVYCRIANPHQSRDLASGSAGAMKSLGLELLGVYAGAVGDRALDNLRLGRVFPIDLVERLLQKEERGANPFPPNI